MSCFLYHYNFETATVNYGGKVIILKRTSKLPTFPSPSPPDETTDSPQPWFVYLFNDNLSGRSDLPAPQPRTLLLGLDRYLDMEMPAGTARLRAYFGVRRRGRHSILTRLPLTNHIFRRIFQAKGPVDKDFIEAMREALKSFRRKTRQGDREGSVATTNTDVYSECGTDDLASNGQLEEEEDAAAISDDAYSTSASTDDYQEPDTVMADNNNEPGSPTLTQAHFTAINKHSPPAPEADTSTPPTTTPPQGSPSASSPGSYAPTDAINEMSDSSVAASESKAEQLPSKYALLDKAELRQCRKLIPRHRRGQQPDLKLQAFFYLHCYLKSVLKLPKEFGRPKTLQRQMNRWQEIPKKSHGEEEAEDQETIWDKLDAAFEKIAQSKKKARVDNPPP